MEGPLHQETVFSRHFDSKLISCTLIEELQDVLNQVRDDPDVCAVVVTGAGRGCGSGDDYHDIAPMSEDNPCLLMRLPVYSCICST
jgi:enoyl-CoA hydratase/carnithine racemase